MTPDEHQATLSVAAVVTEIDKRLALLQSSSLLHAARRDELRVLRKWIERGGA